MAILISYDCWFLLECGSPFSQWNCFSPHLNVRAAPVVHLALGAKTIPTSMWVRMLFTIGSTVTQNPVFILIFVIFIKTLLNLSYALVVFSTYGADTFGWKDIKELERQSFAAKIDLCLWKKNVKTWINEEAHVGCFPLYKTLCACTPPACVSQVNIQCTDAGIVHKNSIFQWDLHKLHRNTVLFSLSGS